MAHDLRRLAGRVNLLRAHVELAAVVERDPRHRAVLERLRDTLRDGEKVLHGEADAAPHAEART